MVIPPESIPYTQLTNGCFEPQLKQLTSVFKHPLIPSHAYLKKYILIGMNERNAESSYIK